MKKYSNAFHDDLFSALDQVIDDLSHNFSVFISSRICLGMLSDLFKVPVW